jgi:hypothetical protein
MSKKWILIISICVLTYFVGAFWVLTTQTDKQKYEIDTIGAIPFDALFIIQFDKAVFIDDNFGAPASAWSNLVPNNPLLSWLKKTISSVYHNDNETAALLLHSKVSLSAHPLGKNDLAMLCAIALPSSINEREWDNFLNSLQFPVSQIRYQESTISSIQLEEGMMHFSYIKGMVLASSSSILLQSSIRHINSGESLQQNEQFATVAQTISKNVDIRIFLSHKQIPNLLTIYGNKIPEKTISSLSNTTSWTGLDGNMTPNLLHLNGFVFPSFSTGNYLSIFLGQSNGHIEAWNILPASTNFMMSFALSNVKRFLDDYTNHLDVCKKLNSYKQKLAAIDTGWQQNASELFTSLYPREITLATVPYNNNSIWLTVLRTANPNYALEQLQTQAALLKKDFIVSQGKINNTNVVIYNNPAANLFEALLGDAFGVNKGSFFTLIDDWFIFSDSQGLLKRIASRQNKHTLKYQLSQTEISQYITNNASITMLINSPDKAKDELLSHLHPRLQRAIIKTTKLYPINTQILQLRPAGDKLYVNLFSLFESELEKRSQTIPSKTTNIDTQIEKIPAQAQAPEPSPEPEPEPAQPTASAPIVHQPVTQNKNGLRIPVVNHYTKEGEFFVQLPDNDFGLQNKSGKWLWKKPFDTPILDTAYQIDYLRNGKLQLLFSTSSTLYLYDRNGKIVAPYPITWKTPVTNGIAVFDYNKDRDYRIFAAHSDNTIRVYDKRIQPVEGWKPFKCKTAITRVPEFFRIASRDYIVICDEQATYILDRRGNERVKTDVAVTIKSETPIIAQQQPASLKVTTTDGQQAIIYLKDGKVEFK